MLSSSHALLSQNGLGPPAARVGPGCASRERRRRAEGPDGARALRVLGGEGVLALPPVADPASQGPLPLRPLRVEGRLLVEGAPRGLERRVHGVAEALVLLEAARGLV